jgi:hypothetical protein
MTRVLDFWRDVEIFNIPEVPTGAKPGRPNAAAAADTAQYQGIDLDEDNAELPDSESSIRPRSRIVADSGIVVSSYNNTAVKNISLDLPFSCDLDSFPEAAYLPEVAMLVAELFNVKNGQPWGLLSGTLGARPNCEKIAGALMGYEDAVVAHLPDTHPVPGEPSSLKPWLDYVRKRIKASRHINWQQRWNDNPERLPIALRRGGGMPRQAGRIT